MGQIGELAQWDDARGFGFITVPGRTGRIFVHISAFDKRARPALGDRVEFALGTGRDGKPAAIRAIVLGRFARPAPRSGTPEHFDKHNLRVWAACALIALVFAALILDRAPIGLALYYLGASSVSFALYWWDKQSARSARWRTAEARLHAIDLAGGIIGGLLAQHSFRHKTSKSGFSRISAFIALGHGILLLGMVLGVVDTIGVLTWLDLR